MTDREQHEREFEEALNRQLPEDPNGRDLDGDQDLGNPVPDAGDQGLIPDPTGNPVDPQVDAGDQANAQNMATLDEIIDRFNNAFTVDTRARPTKAKKQLELEEEELHRDKPLAVLPDSFQTTATAAKYDSDLNTHRLWARLATRYRESLGPNPTEAQKAELLAYVEDLEKAKNNIVTNQTRVLECEKQKARFKDALAMPNTSLTRPAGYTPDFRRLDARNINHNVEQFDPSNISSKFKITWNQLVQYGEDNFFSEAEYIKALHRVLKGEAYEKLEHFVEQKRPLIEIKEYFEETYVPKKTLASVMLEISDFNRKPGESLKKCLERFEDLLSKLKKFYDDAPGLALADSHRRTKLHKLVSPATSAYLRRLEENHTEENGYLIRFTDLAKRAHDFEIQMGFTGTVKAPSQTNAVSAFVNNVTPMEVDESPFLHTGGHQSRRDGYQSKSRSGSNTRKSNSPSKYRSHSNSSQGGKPQSRSGSGSRPGGQLQQGFQQKPHYAQPQHGFQQKPQGQSQHGYQSKPRSQSRDRQRPDSQSRSHERTPSQTKDGANTSQSSASGQKPVNFVHQYTINSNAAALMPCPFGSWHPKNMPCYCGTVTKKQEN